MQIEKLPLTQTGILSSMAQDYLSGKELEYSHSFDKRAIKEAIQQRDFSLDKRKVLKKSLLEDYELLFDGFKSGESHQAVYANIKKLEDEKTFTVCTGHQICVLGGPLFFMYKIAATINLAKQLQEDYPDYNFVPVYWMATEDHDFEEIRSVFLFGNSYTWNKEHQSQPVGRMNSNGFDEFLESIESQIREKDKFQSLKKLFEDSYDGKSLASATIQWVHGLFKKHGLVIIDPDKKELKKEKLIVNLKS